MLVVAIVAILVNFLTRRKTTELKHRNKQIFNYYEYKNQRIFYYRGPYECALYSALLSHAGPANLTSLGGSILKPVVRHCISPAVGAIAARRRILLVF